MLIFLWYWVHSVTVDTLCSFLLQSVHLYFHYLQCVERFSFVFISVPSAFLSSSLPPPSLGLLACLLLFIWVHLLSFPPLWFPDIAPCSLLFYRVCPPPHPPRPVLSALHVLFKVGLWVSVSVCCWWWWISGSDSVVSDDHNKLIATSRGDTFCTIDLSSLHVTTV